MTMVWYRIELAHFVHVHYMVTDSSATLIGQQPCVKEPHPEALSMAGSSTGRGNSSNRHYNAYLQHQAHLQSNDVFTNPRCTTPWCRRLQAAFMDP